MNNVVSFRNQHKPKAHDEIREARRTFDFRFYLGIGLTFVLPQVGIAHFFGVFATLILLGCSLLGAGIGLEFYRKFPYAIVSCVPQGRVTAIRNNTLRLAA